MVLTPALLTATLRRRPRRPIFVIDAAIPADADPAINGLDGVFLYDLADLERVAITGRETRAAAAADAWHCISFRPTKLAAFHARSLRAARGAARCWHSGSISRRCART